MRNAQRIAMAMVLAGGVAAGVAVTATAAGNPTIVSLQAVVDGKSFNVKPAQTIPVKRGETFTMTLVGTEVDSSGKVTHDVPVDATFSATVDGKRLTLSDATANGVDVTVHATGRHGDFIAYKVTRTGGVDVRRGLAEGYIHLE